MLWIGAYFETWVIFLGSPLSNSQYFERIVRPKLGHAHGVCYHESDIGPPILGDVYTMDYEVVPRPSKRCDWTLKSSQDDLGLHQGKNGIVTTEVEVHKFVFLSLLYPLPWSNGYSVGTSKRGGLGKIATAHVRKMPF